MLIGLNLGPNLFVTGSLAWLLWLRAARDAGGATVREKSPVISTTLARRSAGREGPIVQSGSALASSVGQRVSTVRKADQQPA